MGSDTLYLKIDRNVLAKGPRPQVTIKDVATVVCGDSALENKVRAMRFPTDCVKGPGRYVFSVLDVITAIQKEYPKLEIASFGEADFILTVESGNRPPEAVCWGKTVFVCLLAFFGAAFSIMAFNNDVGITVLFRQIYEVFTGEPSDGFTVLELSYSVGVGLGILVFFHHFARRKGLSDPTPLEVEMRTYEDDVDTALIEAGGRGGRG